MFKVQQDLVFEINLWLILELFYKRNSCQKSKLIINEIELKNNKKLLLVACKTIAVKQLLIMMWGGEFYWILSQCYSILVQCCQTDALRIEKSFSFTCLKHSIFVSCLVNLCF